LKLFIAGWSSLVARQAHNLKVAGSNPAPAPNSLTYSLPKRKSFLPNLFVRALKNYYEHNSKRPP
jgi:hypothetical protein